LKYVLVAKLGSGSLATTLIRKRAEADATTRHHRQGVFRMSPLGMKVDVARLRCSTRS
jgi:hypothetical protein